MTHSGTGLTEGRVANLATAAAVLALSTTFAWAQQATQAQPLPPPPPPQQQQPQPQPQPEAPTPAEKQPPGQVQPQQPGQSQPPVAEPAIITPQIPVNATTHANRARSTHAPIISAGVIAAKVSWNIANALSGIVSPSRTSPRFMSIHARPLPSHPPVGSPNASV